jgi:glycerol-3-phosphate dehydrogenase
MPGSGARDAAWARLDQAWDVLVIGGGITGAAILAEATRAGLKAALVEQRDFAWGTSSRSSKLVHGGLRYLSQGHFRLTRESVREREHLLRAAPGLVQPMDFMLASYEGDRPGPLAYGIGLAIYDLFAGSWDHQRHGPDGLRERVPDLERTGLRAGFRYRDAQTDDSRLVLRVLREAAASGATALNYAPALELLREGGQVVGARVQDAVRPGRTAECRARVVINATGAWADRLRQQVGAPVRMRPLRGSHLVFSGDRLPVKSAVTLQHPADHRVFFIIPWEGVTVVGTTDLDHGQPLDTEAAISPAEVAYLMAAADARFPSLHLTLDDIISTYSGVRPVVNTGKAQPSKEAREHVIWEESGLVTVTGGKLTTFRVIAQDTLRAIRKRLPPAGPARPPAVPIFQPAEIAGPEWERVAEQDRQRLAGRYGADALPLIRAAGPGELERVPGASVLWAELRWAVRSEWVEHLEDLMLRRVRLGLIVPQGGRALLPRIREICQAELGWDDGRWALEEASYLQTWRACYSLPDRSLIPEWKAAARSR